LSGCAVLLQNEGGKSVLSLMPSTESPSAIRYLRELAHSGASFVAAVARSVFARIPVHLQVLTHSIQQMSFPESGFNVCSRIQQAIDEILETDCKELQPSHRLYSAEPALKINQPGPIRAN
jgi:hypothetical protein